MCGQQTFKETILNVFFFIKSESKLVLQLKGGKGFKNIHNYTVQCNSTVYQTINNTDLFWIHLTKYNLIINKTFISK